MSIYLLMTKALTYTIDALICSTPAYNQFEMDIVRLIMTLAMHMYVYESARTGIAMMKFSLNHAQRLEAPYSMFALGLGKTLIALYIELLNTCYMLY